jgi:hypothetical protein
MRGFYLVIAMKKVLLLLLLLPVLAPVLAFADDDAMARCRGMADKAARLECYDALPQPGQPPAPVKTVPGKAATAPAAALPSPQVQQQQFGLNQQRPKEAIETITSTIPGDFGGWRRGEIITLANGQVWQVSDDSSRVMEVLHDPRVTIRRGTFGAFYMDFEKDNHSPRVVRVK